MSSATWRLFGLGLNVLDVIKTSLTAYDSDILPVTTIMASPTNVRADTDLPFVSNAFHIVEMDRVLSSTERGTAVRNATDVAKLTARYGSINVVKEVIADRAPYAIVEDLQTTFVGCVAVHETNCEEEGVYVYIYIYIYIYI